jgi:hypothetical protein
MTKAKWTLERVPRMGGATGEAFVNTLQGTGMTPASVLAREAIQNSADAWRQESSEKVKVHFRRVSLVGHPKSSFIKNLGLNIEFAARKKLVGFQHGHALDSIKKPDEPLRLLYVEDFGTHGLYGDPHDPQSHFFRLLLSLGDGTKSRRKEGSGGSYGYGKSVYSANSRIHTIVAYSAFDPKDDGSKHHARLMGCAYLHAHQFAGEDYSGRAWFGVPSTGNAQVVDPLSDEAAHKVAGTLGFTVRDRKSYGTSILIVDCGVDCEDLRTSIEEWWWPRLLDDSLGLDIKLFEEDKLLQPPRPRTRSDLKPFIHCFEMAIGRTMPAGKQDKTGTLNKWKDVAPGSFGFSTLDEKDLADEALQQKSGQVALIRSPRMVVSYMPVGGSLPLPCVGVFVASTEVDKALRISEPPSHDKWDSNSTRLLDLPDDERLLVKSVIDRIKQNLRRFSYEAAPPAPKQDLRLKSLERLLGNLFKPPTSGGRGGGGYPADPIEINFVEQPHLLADGSALRTAGSFRLALADTADKPHAKVSVEVECLVMEDEGVSKEDAIPTAVATTDVEHKTDKEKPGRLIFKLERHTKPLFSFKSDAYRSDWTTRLKVSVKEVT